MSINAMLMVNTTHPAVGAKLILRHTVAESMSVALLYPVAGPMSVALPCSARLAQRSAEMDRDFQADFTQISTKTAVKTSLKTKTAQKLLCL